MKLAIFWLLTTLICSTVLADVEKGVKPPLHVMFYNVENLFDAKHDEGKEDWTFTPKATVGKAEYCQTIKNPHYKAECEQSDWTEAKLKIKLEQIKKAIMSYNQKRPDILGLAEVENEYVVSLLAKELGFSDYLVTQSPDKRGVDVALLYNSTADLQYISHSEIEVKGTVFKKKPTRNILTVDLLLYGQYGLTVAVNHWPSQANPGQARVLAAEHLIRFLDQKKQEKQDQSFVLLGDFNTLAGDFPHAFHSIVYPSKYKFKSLHDQFWSDKKINYASKKSMAPGTYFYIPKMEWNLLDHFFVDETLLDGMGIEAQVNSYKIVSHTILTRDFLYEDRTSFFYGNVIRNIPLRYNFQKTDSKGVGFSDHFPIVFKLYEKRKSPKAWF